MDYQIVLLLRTIGKFYFQQFTRTSYCGPILNIFTNRENIVNVMEIIYLIATEYFTKNTFL